MKKELLNLKVGTATDWKFGLITYDVYRINEDEFEITDTSSGWYNTILNKKLFEKILDGKVSLNQLDWE